MILLSDISSPQILQNMTDKEDPLQLGLTCSALRMLSSVYS